MKFYDVALGLIILFIGGGIGIYILLKMGITFPIMEKNFVKFFGIWDGNMDLKKYLKYLNKRLSQQLQDRENMRKGARTKDAEIEKSKEKIRKVKEKINKIGEQN